MLPNSNDLSKAKRRLKYIYKKGKLNKKSYEEKWPSVGH